jgi:hypothetical protein
MDQNGGPHNASSPGYSPPANRPINLHQGNSTQFNPIQPSIHRPPRVQSNAKFSKPNQAQSRSIKVNQGQSSQRKHQAITCACLAKRNRIQTLPGW